MAPRVLREYPNNDGYARALDDVASDLKKEDILRYAQPAALLIAAEVIE
jgi:hypothetical protein